MTRVILVRLSAALAATVITSCGSASPTQPATSPRPTAFGIINGNSGFPDILLGPGDDVPIIGLTDTGPNGTTLPVPEGQMQLQSSNPSVLLVKGSHVVGVSPGEADIRATFQSFAATSHARVFPPSAVVRLTFDGPSSCSPADHLDVVIRAVLDDGTLIQKPTVTWRSSAPSVVLVEPDDRIACKSPGQATLEVTYQGKIASKQVTVRTP